MENLNKVPKLFGVVMAALLVVVALLSFRTYSPAGDEMPNILFAISDDQSFPHTSVYGASFLKTPSFDQVAQRGVLFSNAFCAAPQCSPSRAAILTGLNIWQLEEAGTHSSYFPSKFSVFTGALEDSGYQLGYTGKPWGPGNWRDSGWHRNPVGPEFNQEIFQSVPHSGINKRDYASNFIKFHQQKDKDAPFFFWYGGHEPHRVFEKYSGLKEGKKIEDAQVPDFMPDVAEIKSDVLDYAVEIEWFDQQLGKMLEYLDQIGELDKTIVVITADNGMAFPAAKANLHEFGTHVPLAIAGPGIQEGVVNSNLVSLIDLAPTFLDFANCRHLPQMSGRSLYSQIAKQGDGVQGVRSFVLTGRERHTHARPDNLGYPARAIRTDTFLYIRNFKPDRWPAGDPAAILDGLSATDGDFKYMEGGYHDIDASPSKSLLLDSTEKYLPYFDLAMARRPGEQLYNIISDPGCTKNLAYDPEHKMRAIRLANKLFKELSHQGDPRMLGTGYIFDSYPRFARMRAFPGFRERGQYNPTFQPRK